MAQKRSYSSIAKKASTVTNNIAERKTRLEENHNKPCLMTMADVLRRGTMRTNRSKTDRNTTTEEFVTVNGFRVRIESKCTLDLVKSFNDYEKERNENMGCSRLSRLLKNQGYGSIRYDLKIVEFTPVNQVKGEFGYTCKHRISHCVYEAQFKKAFITWPYCSKQTSSTFMNYAIPVSKREVPLLNHGSYLDVRDIDSNGIDDITVRNVLDESLNGEECVEGAQVSLIEPSKVLKLLKSHFKPCTDKDWRSRAREEGVAFGTVYKMNEINNPKWKSSNFTEIMDGMKIVSNDEYNCHSQCITTIGMKDGIEIPLLFKVDKKHISLECLRRGSLIIPCNLQNCLSIISKSFGGSSY